jgi:pimeloyl-ACP methyl ester carboxylesterase
MNRRLGLLAGGTLASAATAAITAARANAAERANPPKGQFIVVDDVLLHFIELGVGDPIVLLHGNGVSSEDFVLCGAAERLAAGHRVIIFDRPGFGYSARPRTRRWTPQEQAELLHAALVKLHVVRPTIVGHSWGTLVALGIALAYPDDVRGLVLASGYYYPTLGADAPLASIPTMPVVGDVMRYTISPIVSRLMLPWMIRELFFPAPIAESFKKSPFEMWLRPSTLRAVASETATMNGAARALSQHYDELRMPIDVVAGSGDLIVKTELQSARLAAALGAPFHLVEGAGHMVHHTAPERFLAAIAANIANSASAATPTPAA